MSFPSLPWALTRSRSDLAKRAGKAPQGTLRSRRLRCEPLEQRTLLSLGSISGTVFEDLDADGFQDAGEPGLADWTVVLERGDASTPLLTIPNPSPDEGDLFGFTVAPRGNDVLVGALEDDAGGITDVGAAYLFDGSTGDLLHTFSNPDPEENDRFGCSVAAVGDMVFVGTRRSNDTYKEGVAYLFNADTGQLLRTLVDPSLEPNPESADRETFGGVASSVAVWGDHVFVGDDHDDTAGDETGAVFLFDTSTGNLVRTFVSPNPSHNGSFGVSVAVVGDNVLIGADRDDTAGGDAGAAYLFDAATGELLQTFLNPSPDSGDEFGRGIAAFGDNVFVSARKDDTDGTDAGIFYLFDSSTGGLLETFHSPRPQDASFARWLATDGNLIVAGSVRAEMAVENGGAAYVFDGTSGELVATIENPTPEPRDTFGRWGAFRDNGDLLLSCTKDDAGGVDAGAAYVFSTVQTTSSDSAGDYSFQNLDPDTYEVREVVKDSYTQTSPGGDGTHSVTLAAGQDVTGLDFGNQWQPTTLFADSFENGEWDGKWVEDSQRDWFDSTQRKTDGNYSAEVDGWANNATLTMAQAVDLTPYGSAELTFDWYIESGFDSGEYLALDFSPDGSTWTQIKRLRGNVDPENTWHNETINVDPMYLTGGFKVRFRAYVSGSREDANVDNVQLFATSLAGPPNEAPVADADGPYSTVEGGQTLLDGSGSSDLDGVIVSYEWDLDGDGQYDDATGATATYNAGPSGVFSVGLQVTDDRGGTGADTAQITVGNVGPTAEGGGPCSGSEGSNIVLSAAGSTDPGNDIVAYDWDLDNDAAYDDASGVTAVFNSSVDGVYTVGLQVTDDDGESSTDTATVTLQNVAPTADAGGPYTTGEGVDVSLSAAGSTDPGHDIVSYEWDFDNDGQYDDATGVTATFNSATAGSYTVGVKVTDDDGASSTDTSTVAVGASETEVFADSFEVGEWNGQWVEDSQNDWFRSTQRATHGSRSAEVDGSATDATLTMATPVDLTPYGTAILTFDWLIEKGFDSGEYLALDVYDGSWHELARLRGNVDPENTWHQETIDVSPYLADDFQVRFRAKVSGSREDANVDDVQIVASGTSPASAMATDLALLAWVDLDSSDDEDTDPRATQAADELALMMME